MIGVASLVLMVLVLFLVVVAGVVVAAGALVLLIFLLVLLLLAVGVPVVDDFLVVGKEDTRAFLGWVLVDLGMVSGVGALAAAPTGAGEPFAAGGDNGCSTVRPFTLAASSFFLSCIPHSLARRLASSSLLFLEERGAANALSLASASIDSPSSSSSSARLRLLVGGAMV